MPEGDTLRKIADFLAPRLTGLTVVAARVAGVQQPELTRRSVLGVSALGKHLTFALGPEGDGWTLRVHLGMYGSWHSYPAGVPWRRPAHRASVVLTLSNATDYVCFDAQNASLAHTPSEDRTLAALGPNLLAPAPQDAAGFATTLDAVVKRVHARPADTLVLDALLDQRVAAGFGNVYKSELLYYFRLPWTTQLGMLDEQKRRDIWAQGMRWLAANLGGWARTTTVDRRTQALPPRMPRLYVYARARAPCLRCETPIVRALLGRHRRSTYWCPACQVPQIASTR